tara:strand:+ start:12712 stop:13749 length:1038 start_codon:yes stop_codon:yes gene_type:complete
MYEEFENKFKKVIVTGGYGFIGSCIVRNLLIKTKCKICNIDKINYASNLKSINNLTNDKNLNIINRYEFHKIDINNNLKIKNIFDEFEPDLVLHLAAETHVDKSIINPKVFIDNNIIATFNLLDTAKNYWEQLRSNKKEFLFIHVSTDEVFGSLDKEGFFNEDSPYKPSSPYSASKAASDHLVKAWHATYNFPAIVTNCSNNYGPWQYPDKLIPVIINRALNQKYIPIYGKGENIRDWLYVEDHAEAILLTALKGKLGKNYCIGGKNERTNIEMALKICEILDRYFPERKPHKNLIQFTQDRLGHDFRYSIDNKLIQDHIGWYPKFDFESSLKETIDWFINNQNI